MHTPEHEIEQLETAFWQSIVDGQPQVATGLLTEPALMVSAHGALSFDHDTYIRMTEKPPYRLVSFALSDFRVLFPREDVAIATYKADQEIEHAGEKTHMPAVESSTWLKRDGEWKCVAHTESLQTTDNS
ncbi:nuclear transport factor 2 family protein [Thermomonas brevis]